jgi:hypothetical protein
MNKLDLLAAVRTALDKGEIQQSDIAQMLESQQKDGAAVVGTDMSASKFTLLLYGIGALIVAVGLVIFISQIWEQLGSAGRVLVTLGMGLSCAFAGSVVLFQKKSDMLGGILHALGALLIPGGIFVQMYEMNVEPDAQLASLVFGSLAVVYAALMYVHKHAVLTLCALGCATTASYAMLSVLFDGMPNSWDIAMYLTIVWGACYIMLGTAFVGTWNAPLVRALYFFGILGLLGAAFSQVVSYGVWEVLYIPLLVGSVFTAIHIRSTSVLMVSTAFLVAYIAYITSEYFADSVGWPLALVFIGCVLIGCGYASVAVNKKYIQR